MRAMVLEKPGQALQLAELPIPICGDHDILIRVKACGVCRTDLHILDNELTGAKLPLIPGHEIVGVVAETGEKVVSFSVGQRVGVPWLAHSCGICRYCLSMRENLCDNASFTGYTVNGGYAEYAVADHRYCFKLPAVYSDTEAAPMLCAGLIGYRALAGAGNAQRVGIYGFGASAHIISQIARYEGREVYAFTRPGDVDGQDFARKSGAIWAGDSGTAPPKKMDAAILFAPVGALIPEALCHTAKGGAVICAGIHMSDIPAFPYSILWGERSVKSIANLTRLDGKAFFRIAPKARIKTQVATFPLEMANTALSQLRAGKITGAAVLTME